MQGQQGESRGADISMSRRRMLAGSAGTLSLAGVTGTASAGQTTENSNRERTRTSRSTTTSNRETHGMYIHPRWYWNDDSAAKSRQAMNDWLTRADQAGINTLYAWVESPDLASILGEPKYADKYRYWNRDGWDGLQALISDAGQYDMDVLVWYSFTRYKRQRDWVPEYDSDMSKLPDGSQDWASIRKSEYMDGYTGPSDSGVSGDALCNNEFEAHGWTLNVLSQIFDAYPGLAGLHVEEPGYLKLDRCVCYRCQNIYHQKYDEPGENLLDHVYGETVPYLDDMKAIPVKVRGTNRFARRLYQWWENRSDVGELSYNGSWDPDWDKIRGRNWPVWSRRGQVPKFKPQIYTSSTDLFGWATKMAMDAVDDQTAVSPTIGIDWNNGSNDETTIIDQIDSARRLDGFDFSVAPGQGLFSGADLSPELVTALRAVYGSGTSTSTQSVGTMSESTLRRQQPLTTSRKNIGTLPGHDVSPTPEEALSMPDRLKEDEKSEKPSLRVPIGRP